MSNQQLKLLRERINEGVKYAIAKAIEKHRQEGTAIPVWKDNKVVYIPASEIPPAKI